MRGSLQIAAVACTLAAAGCTTLPKSAPLLSQEVGRMIADGREAHQAMLDQYRDERRARAAEYLREVVTPRFIRQLLDPEQGGLDFDKKICGLQGMDRAMELQELIEAINTQVQSKRAELDKAIYDVDGRLRTAVRRHYDVLERANRILTDNLASAAVLDETRNELLRQLGVPESAITPVDEAEKALDDLLK